MVFGCGVVSWSGDIFFVWCFYIGVFWRQMKVVGLSLIPVFPEKCVARQILCMICTVMVVLVVFFMCQSR